MKEINFWNSSRTIKKKRPGFQSKIKSPFIPNVKFGIPVKPLNIKKKNMDWSQAKAHFPRLKPLGDIDKDGVKNKFDCKPFDRKRHGFFSDIFTTRKKIARLEHEAYLQKWEQEREWAQEKAQLDAEAEEEGYYEDDDE